MSGVVTNPYLPTWEYIPDGEPHVFGDRLYVFGSHDAADGEVYCVGDYVCWSAPVDDLASWRFEGTIWRKIDDPLCGSGSGYGAPDVCQGADGRYYLYYFTMPTDFTLGPVMGVAVCDEPAGRYRYVGPICLPDGSMFTWSSGFGQPFDPAVLPTDDGCWLYYGFGNKKRGGRFPDAACEGGFVVKLRPDMHTMVAEPKRLAPAYLYQEGTGFEGHAFFEASSVRVLDGRYYFVYSSANGHELCWATMPGPEGPLTYGGVLISNGDVGLPGHETEDKAVVDLGNNHGGMVRVNGRDYIFYHRHTHGAQHARQGCAEPFTIKPDGTIDQVEVTCCGLNGGPLPAGRTYPAGICCFLNGPDGPVHYSGKLVLSPDHPVIDQELDAGCPTSSRLYLRNLCDGAAFGYKYLAFDGQEQAVFEVRGAFDGELVVRLDAPDGAEVARVAVFGLAEDDWHEVAAPLAPGAEGAAAVAGTHAVYVAVAGSGALDVATIAFR